MNDNDMANMIKKAQEMINNNQVPDELKNLVANMQIIVQVIQMILTIIVIAICTVIGQIALKVCIITQIILVI